MQLEGFIAAGSLLKSGIYALVHRGVVVYVGKSKMMLGRIYSHRVMWGRAKRGNKLDVSWASKGILFDDVWIRPCALNEIDKLEYEMINLYKPKYNRNLKNGLAVNLPPDIITLISAIVPLQSSAPRPLKPEGTILRRV